MTESKEKIKEKNKLASSMYRGAKMGTQTIKVIIPKTQNKQLKEELFRQLELYNEIENELYLGLISRKIEPLDINPFQSLSAWVMINTQLLFNRKPSHIASMLIKGNNMGVIGITKILNQNKNQDEFLIDYGIKFINLIENNNENLKCFL